jgi:hypothetical protein
MQEEKKGIFKRILSYSFLALMALPLVSAVAEGTWYGDMLSFIGIPMDSWQSAVIGLIVMLIIAAGIYDILELIGIFENTIVKLIISIGIGAITGISGGITAIIVYMAGIVANMGAIGIFLEVGVAIIIFIGLSFGSSAAANFSAKRKAAKAQAKGIELAGTLKGLKEAGKGL